MNGLSMIWQFQQGRICAFLQDSLGCRMFGLLHDHHQNGASARPTVFSDLNQFVT